MTTSSISPIGYPVTFSVDYPDRKLNKLTTFFRIFAIIPIAIILGLLGGGGGWNETWPQWGDWHVWLSGLFAAGGILFIPTLLMILFRQKYPRWWYDWNINLLKFSLRVGVYGALMRDEYPSTDEEQAVHLDIPYPDAKTLSQGLPLVKWFLAIPHYIVLAVLAIAAMICVIISWFAILFTGNYPKSLFGFVMDVTRWGLRVEAYAFLLTTDRYPPFRLRE